MDSLDWYIILIPLFIGLLVALDASRRGMNPFGWGIFVFLLLIIGLPAYLLSRKPVITGKKKCPYCAEFVNEEAIVCRYCNKILQKKCPYCAELVEVEASVCKHCKKDILAEV